MKTIWRYPIDMAEEQSVRMPKGARVLSVQRHGKETFLYALLTAHSAYTTRTVRVRSTDDDCDGLAAEEYVGTVALDDHRFVFHVFVEKESVS